MPTITDKSKIKPIFKKIKNHLETFGFDFANNPLVQEYVASYAKAHTIVVDSYKSIEKHGSIYDKKIAKTNQIIPAKNPAVDTLAIYMKQLVILSKAIYETTGIKVDNKTILDQKNLSNPGIELEKEFK